jgi:hypothetical protein
MTPPNNRWSESAPTGGAVLATLASLVIFAGGTALVMGAVKGLAVMKPEGES